MKTDLIKHFLLVMTIYLAPIMLTTAVIGSFALA